MDTLSLFYLLLVPAVSTWTVDQQSLELDEYINLITRSDDIDGYGLASVHAMDTATFEERGQTKRDIEEHASNSASNKQSFSLQLTSGETLRMSLKRRSIDTSLTRVYVNTEEGKREIHLQPRDCFFSGPLESEEGFASLSMCGGSLMGSISTEKRDYEVHKLPDSENSKRSADDVMRVLVTWQEVDRADGGLLSQLSKKRQVILDGWAVPEDEPTNEVSEKKRQLVLDGWEIPGGEPTHDGGQPLVKKRDDDSKKASIEVADYLDSQFLNVTARRLNLTTDDELIDLIVRKWSSVNTILSDKEWIGWEVVIELKRIEIWRTNPSWYKTNQTDDISVRMGGICKGTKDLSYDHVMVHTGQVKDYRLGLAWIGAVCWAPYRCAAVQGAEMNFRLEIHEFGHVLGLNHDNLMKECANDTDKVNGFMGFNRFHTRGCYLPILDKTFQKGCLHTENVQEPVKPLMSNFTIKS